MPEYEYECPQGHHASEVRRVDERDEPMPCLECNVKDGSVVEMKRIPSTFSGRVLGGTPTFFPGRRGK